MIDCKADDSTHKTIAIGWTAALLAVIVFVADLVSKYLTQETLPLIAYSTPQYPYGGIPVFENIAGIEFSLVHAINRGAAWGVLSNFQVPLLVGRMILVAILSYFLLFMNKKSEWRLPLTLIVAGAVGNIVDFFIYGHVIDMFHFVLWGYDFPVFNVADAAISIGIGWMFLLSFLEDKKTA